MVKKIPQTIISLLIFSCVFLFAGCIKFENSFDLSPSVQQPVASSEQHFQPNYETTSYESTVTVEEDLSRSENISSESTEESSSAASETAAAPESTTKPEQPEQPESTTEAINAPEDTEYDILRKDEFTFEGTIVTGEENLDVNISSGEDKIYFTTAIDNLKIGLYTEGKKTYIYAPEKKKYLKMNNAVAKLLKMDPSTFIEMAQGLGFDKLPQLSAAQSVESSSVNGTSCEKYVFRNTEEDMYIYAYLNGKKLLRIEYVDSEGNASTTITFRSVSAGFPKMPPDGFEEIGYLEFFKLIADEV